MNKLFVLSVGSFFVLLKADAQPDRWQQKVKYTMSINMNVQTNQFAGKQKLEYWNNSPDTLTRVFIIFISMHFSPVV